MAAWAWNWLADIGLPVEFADWAGDQVQRAADLRRDQGPVDWLIQFLEAAASDGRHPVPMEADQKSGQLRVGVAAARSGYDLWQRDHGLPRLDPEPELVHRPVFREKANTRIFGHQTKSWVFDLAVLADEYGIHADFWPRTAREGA